MTRSASIVAALIAAIGCGNRDGSEAEPITPVPDPSPPVVAPATGAALTVHEWGLIDVQLGQTSGRVHGVPSSAPAPTPAEPASSRAPLLYFHLAPQAQPLDVTVRVAMPTGEVAEHWPPANEISADRRTVTWRAKVRSGTCAGSSYPPAGEAAGLAAYESTDASCLTVGGADFNHLFYAGTTTVPMPLSITREGDGVRVLNQGPEIPGAVYIIRRNADRAQTLASGQLAHPGIPMTMRPQWPTTTPQMFIPPSASMVRYGISYPEIAAFERAWDAALFGATPPAADATPQPTDFVLFWLAPSLTDQVSTIEIEPRPAALARALLVRVDLAAGT